MMGHAGGAAEVAKPTRHASRAALPCPGPDILTTATGATQTSWHERSTCVGEMEYVDTQARLVEVAERLAGARLVGADTEAAGYHRYVDRVCLLQLSTRSETFVIDTLEVHDLRPLAPIFGDPQVEMVFHDGDYDLRLLNRDFGAVVRGLFDTKIAAQFLGERTPGLAAVVEKYLGIRLEKKYQRADWAQRPLPPELVAYAAEDTKYLPALRDRLREELEARGRLSWAEEEFRIEEQVRWTPPAPEQEAYLRLKGTRDLTPRQLAALREVYQWREEVARARDVATFRVVSNETLVELARQMPSSLRALAGIPGLPRSLVGQHGREILEAIERARKLPPEALPVRPRGPGRPPPPDPEFFAAVERLRAARDAAATRLELDPGFLMPRFQLEELARRRPRTREELAELPGIRQWRVEAIGDELLAALWG